MEKYKTTLIAKASIPITPSIPTPSLTVAPPKDIPVKFRTIDQFSWDQGEYNSPTVTVYVDIDGIGTLKDTPNITCQFTKDTFDLKVFGLNGNNYRFLILKIMFHIPDRIFNNSISNKGFLKIISIRILIPQSLNILLNEVLLKNTQ